MKTACVTGATGGLGIELTRSCLNKGFKVFATDLRETDKIQEISAAFPDRFQFMKLDVTNPAEIELFGKWVENSTDHMDLLVNALGIYTQNSTRELESLDIEQSLKMYDVNALGPLRIVKRLIPLVLRSEDKVVVNISSEAASMAASAQMTSRYDYGMSKAALNMQTTILQRQYGPNGVKFLLFHPGWINTEMGRFSGGHPTVDPHDSAEGILAVAHQMRGRVHDWMYYDYNGTPRPW